MKFCCYTPYNNKKKKCSKCNKKLIKSTNKYLFGKLPYDIIQYILHLYYNSKNMYYYSNLSLVSKTFNYNFNILFKSSQYIPYNNIDKFNKSIYYVSSKYFNIKFAKLYFHKTQGKFNLLFGEENTLLSSHKNYETICFTKNELHNLIYFRFIMI